MAQTLHRLAESKRGKLPVRSVPGTATGCEGHSGWPRAGKHIRRL